ncbi:MAG: hypothetical protein J2P41_00755, partial [Blastocatellia bacterium]|nr:hypothetical protein [Blastocatellia bacterium]
MNFALVAFRVPENYRAYLDATIGASLGSTDWFEAADIEVGQRAKEVSSQGLKQKTIEKWTQRQRDDFAEWQTAWRVTLIETMPGGKAQGKNIKTRYRLKNLFEVALEVDRRARFIPGYDKNPKRALRKAAAAIYTEFSARLKDPPKRERFRRPTQNSDTCLTLINTYIQKYVGLALLENRNLDAGLEGISLKIDRIRELLKNSTAPIENSTQIAQILQDTRISGWTKMSTQNSLHLLPADALNSPDRLPDAPPENQQFVHTLNEEYGQEIEAPEAPAEPPPAPETMKPQDSRAFRGSPVT